ncbi:MAG: NUDIX hydrolase [Marinilabiliales bacterium]|nr:MAG: NUDIX hydrolase [Marinilabiliales bacterium]
MYKVFYKDRTVFFVENDQNIIEPNDHKIHHYSNKKQLKIAIDDFLILEELNDLYVVCKDIDMVFNEFSSFYKIIEAAGGLVKDKDQNILMIFRRGKWDLPKGKIEKNELPEVAAIREVEEECGIEDLEIQRSLEITYHTYQLKGKDILKKTYWYQMIHNGIQEPVPQVEEDITEVKWVKPKEVYTLIQYTYPSIIDVLKKGEIL